MTTEEREAMMVLMYGEVCTKTAASRILGRSAKTVNRMLEDGRLDAACEGTRVDVRSIARYITAPKQEDFEARKRRYMQAHKSNWAV